MLSTSIVELYILATSLGDIKYFILCWEFCLLGRIKTPYAGQRLTDPSS